MRRRPSATYVDTSIWCASCFHQDESAAAIQWLDTTDMARMGAAWWVETEFASALGIQLRKKALNRHQARWARDRFADLMGMVHRLNVIEADYLHAAELCAADGLRVRGADALHLAVAQRHGCTALATLDTEMGDAAVSLGFELVTI